MLTSFSVGALAAVAAVVAPLPVNPIVLETGQQRPDAAFTSSCSASNPDNGRGDVECLVTARRPAGGRETPAMRILIQTSPPAPTCRTRGAQEIDMGRKAGSPRGPSMEIVQGDTRGAADCPLGS